MVQIPDKIKNTIDTYLKALNNDNIPVKEAMLFTQREKNLIKSNYGKITSFSVGINKSSKRIILWQKR